VIHGRDGAEVGVIPALVVMCSACGGAVAVVNTDTADLAEAGVAARAHLEAKHGGRVATRRRVNGE
jgi:NCAIR mutase (PurE)-related protein